MNNINELYSIWLEKTAQDPEAQAQLLKMKDNAEEIKDSFYRNLEFGTAGLRGVLGTGTNRMNRYTVGQATKGLADYLNANYENPAVAIGYDSRIKSDEFARLSACILAENGIKVYLYSQLMPTPMISFAVMKLKCQSGIVITASHNPSKYNGYKCYDPAGYQMTEEAADETYSYIAKTDMFSVRQMDFDTATGKGLIEYISDEVINDFYSQCLSRPIHPEVIRDSDVKIIYSPLNGTGNIPVRTVLAKAGFSDIHVVKEQELPDGNFPTCPYPNPEIKQVFECGIEMTKDYRADLLLATDPDCDRVGVAVLSKGEYKLLSGNEMGALLTNYLLSERKAAGTLPAKPVIIKSFVSTKLVDKICAKYGAELIETLTGFKYIGECIQNLEKAGRLDDFIMGFEESYGYLIGGHARDKDAVAASLMICEMTAFYRKQGKTLVDVLDGLYEEFGYCCDVLQSYTFEGADGMVRMASIMDEAAAAPPAYLDDFKVLKQYNYRTGVVVNTENGATESTGLPKSNILAYALPGGNHVIVRPSGTEPKIKLYITGIGAGAEQGKANAEKIGEAMKKLLGIR